MASIDQPITLASLIESGYLKPMPERDRVVDVGHIEGFNELVCAVPVGRPGIWMKSAIESKSSLDIVEVPKEFRDFYAKFNSDELDEIKACYNILSTLANLNYLKDLPNESQEDKELIGEYKKLYRTAEMRIIYLINQKIDEIKGELGIDFTEENTIVGIALNGGKIMETQEFGGEGNKNNFRIQLKRMEIKPTDEEIAANSDQPPEYYIGVGPQIYDLLNMPQDKKDKVEYLIIPDDCVSTGITEAVVMQLFKLAGFNNIKRVFLISSIGVNTGLDYLSHVAKGIFPQAELTLASAGVCTSVTGNMYLQEYLGQLLGFRFKVGDMGWFNKISDEEMNDVPKGEVQINKTQANSLTNSDFKAEIGVDELREITNPIFGQAIES